MEEDTDPGKENAVERNMGKQPLDLVMRDLGICNHDLVSAIADPLTHKAVQRARNGRRLTPHMQRRVVSALNACVTSRKPENEPPNYTVTQLFNYVSK